MSNLLQDLGGATMKTGLPPPWSVSTKPCDYCKSSSALLFCRVDSVFLCMACDSKIHNNLIMTNKLKHEKVWICEVCEQAPASFTCKADAAALCVTCDRDIHSANPLARRHERIPAVPFYDTAAESVLKTSASTILSPISDINTIKQVPYLGSPGNLPIAHSMNVSSCGSLTNKVACLESWVFPDHVTSKFTHESPDLKSVEFLLSQSDQLLEFDYPISNINQFNSGSDSVVPVQALDVPLPSKFLENLSKNHFEINFSKPNINSCNNSFTTPSLINSVSSSSIDVGVVPDGSSKSETSFSLGTSVSGGNYQGAQVLGIDRKARVLRYREKRKNRKFEKTIRYASRKAYAEKRPRIKGRFAKRTQVDVDGEIDQLFATASSGFSLCDFRYGVVPNFQ